MPLLFELSSLHFGHRAFGVELLKDLSLKLEEGVIFGLLGPGGSGKTTLLKLLAGLLKPERGEILFRGRSILEMSSKEKKEFRRSLGMTFQRQGLFDSLNCYENLAFPARELLRLQGHQLKNCVEKLLDDVGLSSAGTLRMHEMSGGMQKRLLLARALLSDPDCLLCDDPTAGLDPITSRTIVDLIHSLTKKNTMSVIWVTSSPTLALTRSTDVGLLYHGSFVDIASAEAFRVSPNAHTQQFLRGLLKGPMTPPDLRSGKEYRSHDFT